VDRRFRYHMNMSSDVAASSLDGCDARVVDRKRVTAVQRRLPDADTIEELAEVFGLLSDPSRLRLIASLLEGGELCVCDLAATSGMGESAASHALRLLRAHRVVRVRRDGRMARYSLCDGHVRMLLDVALEHLGHADSDPSPVEGKRS
jgi:ArsR family transcriptional regulator, lead/cadmium/zinc/bismuth-responsive transcriptional repressor